MAPIFDQIINGIQRSLGGTRQKAFAGDGTACTGKSDILSLCNLVLRSVAELLLMTRRSCAVSVALLGVVTTALVFGSIYIFAGDFILHTLALEYIASLIGTNASRT